MDENSGWAIVLDRTHASVFSFSLFCWGDQEVRPKEIRIAYREGDRETHLLKRDSCADIILWKMVLHGTGTCFQQRERHLK